MGQTNFEPGKFSNLLNPFRIGHYKTVKHLSDVNFDQTTEDGAHRNHILPYYPEEPLISPFVRLHHSTPYLITNSNLGLYQDNLS